jgi:hypothetical protein
MLWFCFAFCPQDMKIHSVLSLFASSHCNNLIENSSCTLITCLCVGQCMCERKYASFVQHSILNIELNNVSFRFKWHSPQRIMHGENRWINYVI